MSAADVIVVVLGIALIAGGVAWFAFFANHPWRGVTSHDSDIEQASRSDELYRTADRPAGPDVGPMDPDRLAGDHRPPL